MTSDFPLREYRCACGKLLCKGMFALCVVEIKCRRCGTVVSFERFDAGGCMLIESDAQGQVVSVVTGPEAPAQNAHSYVLGKRLPELYPLLRDEEASLSSLERPYKLRDNTLLLQDGASVQLSSCILPRGKNGAEGLRILNWKKEN